MVVLKHYLNALYRVTKDKARLCVAVFSLDIAGGNCA